MSKVEELHMSSRKDWHEWLDRNHYAKKEVWLIFYKKDAGKPNISYEASVEEALCYGWVDSIIKKIDEKRYTRKFTPRKSKSRWSGSNIKRAEKMINEGRMTESGFAVIEESKKNGEWSAAPTLPRELKPPLYMKEALAANELAFKNFNKLAKSYKRQYIAWLISAKREETRQKRLTEIIARLERNEKLNLK